MFFVHITIIYTQYKKGRNNNKLHNNNNRGNKNGINIDGTQIDYSDGDISDGEIERDNRANDALETTIDTTNNKEANDNRRNKNVRNIGGDNSSDIDCDRSADKNDNRDEEVWYIFSLFAEIKFCFTNKQKNK